MGNKGGGLMEFNSFSDLSFEMRRVRQLICDQRSAELESLYQRLMKGLKVGKEDIQYFKNKMSATLKAAGIVIMGDIVPEVVTRLASELAARFRILVAV